jgi:hypothetical protein
VVEPLVKVTVPVGAAEIAAEEDVTVATSFTGSPWVVFDGESAKATWLGWLGWFTVSVTALELDTA